MRATITPAAGAVTSVQVNRGSPWAKGLVAWYPMCDALSWGTGIVHDYSGAQQSATMTDALGTGTYDPQWTTAAPWGDHIQDSRPSLYFDDANRCLIDGRGEFQSLQCPMTASGWYLPAGNVHGWLWSQYEHSIDGRLGKGLTVTNSRKLEWYGTKGSDDRYQYKTSTMSFPQWIEGGRFDNWVFWGYSVSGSLAAPELTLTLNGEVETFSLVAMSANIDPDVVVAIGGSTRGPSDFETCRGYQRDLRFWNRSMDAAEHQALRHETITGSLGSLAQQYRPMPRAAEGAAATALPAAMNTYQQMMRGS